MVPGERVSSLLSASSEGPSADAKTEIAVVYTCIQDTAQQNAIVPLKTALSYGTLHGLISCTLIYYKYYHHSCFGLCCGAPDREVL